MKKIIIELNVTNDAFRGENMSMELSRIFKQLGADLDSSHLPGKLKDINGNSVGNVKVEY